MYHGEGGRVGGGSRLKFKIGLVYRGQFPGPTMDLRWPLARLEMGSRGGCRAGGGGYLVLVSAQAAANRRFGPHFQGPLSGVKRKCYARPEVYRL
jgi:hypothetical protein